MDDDTVAGLINNLLRDVLMAKQAVMINMVRQGLLPSGGWAIGQYFEIDDDGNMVQDFVPTRGGISEDDTREVRSDLSVRIIIRVPRPK